MVEVIEMIKTQLHQMKIPIQLKGKVLNLLQIHLQNTSLLENIGNYAGQLMKGVYGDYWSAMFGSDDDTSRISGGKINNVRYGSNGTNCKYYI